LPADLGSLVDSEPAARLWMERRQTNDRELAGLMAALDVPIALLPLLPLDPGPRLAASLGRELTPTLDIAADAA
jgi:hypothetical protein